MVEVAATGMAALAALDRARPDLVVLDIMMPGMTGFDVLDRVKASPQLAAIPVIMLTAKADDGDLLASYRSGADYYITKPLVASQLLYGVGLVLGTEFLATTATTNPPAPRPARPRPRS